MILNISKIKTEALLLFCRDLINSYHNTQDEIDFGVDENLIKEFDKISEDMLKNINGVCFSNEYYLQNRTHYRPKAILKAYDNLNSILTKNLNENQEFNPSMLYFSMLAVWFKELEKESKSKEYIYFLIYPYFNVYDKLLVNMKNDKFKKINIQMIEIAEKTILNYNNSNIV